MALLNLVLGALFTVLGLFDGSGSGDGGAAGGDGGTPGQGAGGPGSDDDSGDDDGDAGDPDTGTDPKAEAAKWKALARKHEAKAKANATAATKLKQLEDADKTELEREKDARTASDRRATEAETKLLRMEVAIEKGLSTTQAKRLVGDTREELETDADELLEAFKAEGGDGRTKPATGLRSRSVPGAEPEDNDPTKLAAMVPRT
jgi:hypothetical protein